MNTGKRIVVSPFCTKTGQREQLTVGMVDKYPQKRISLKTELCERGIRFRMHFLYDSDILEFNKYTLSALLLNICRIRPYYPGF